MNTLRKYLLSTFVAIALSLTLANVTALAYCPPYDDAPEYSCFNTGEDGLYCFYECFCLVETFECEAALRRRGYTLEE